MGKRNTGKKRGGSGGKNQQNKGGGGGGSKGRQKDDSPVVAKRKVAGNSFPIPVYVPRVFSIGAALVSITLYLAGPSESWKHLFLQFSDAGTVHLHVYTLSLVCQQML